MDNKMSRIVRYQNSQMVMTVTLTIINSKEPNMMMRCKVNQSRKDKRYLIISTLEEKIRMKTIYLTIYQKYVS